MRPSDFVLRASAVALLAVAAFTLLGNPTVAAEMPIPIAVEAQEAQQPPHGDAPGPRAADGGPAHPTEAAIAEPVFHKSEGRDTTGWTSGVILGDIPLTPSVLDRIQTISVVVDELKNVRAGGTPPWRKVVPVTLGVGTPTFEVRDIPFSDYGYVVRVHSPGLNGGQSTVHINADRPIVDDVKLPITPGSPFSILLRDQDRAPVAATEVRMVPHLEPHGRTTAIGSTDNYGSVVFENMLEGEYHVHVGTQLQPLMEPTTIHVQPGSFMLKGNVVLPQGTTIVVPRGAPMTVLVAQLGGWPVQGARVQLRATDKKRIIELEAETDSLGKATFANLLPGQWEVEISKADFDRRLSQFEVKADATASEQRFEIARIR